MAVPHEKEGRLYYRCAIQRFEDAQILLHADRNTGAVYLAGYGIECILKALVLGSIPAANVEAVLQTFRGAKAHNFESLRTQYLQSGGSRFPRHVTEAFTLVNDWTTDLRYLPRTMKKDEADGFLRAARTIIHWADGRL